jgi:uncharacterized protein
MHCVAKRFIPNHNYFLLGPHGARKTTMLIDRYPDALIIDLLNANGAALEGLVGQHLKAWCDYSSEKHQLFFWRTTSGSEIDFVVYGPLGLWAIEVKFSQKVSTKDVRTLKSFVNDYPMAKPVLVYRGDERIQVGGILCIPVTEFLLSIIPNDRLL